MKVNVAESMSRRQWSTDEFSAVLSAHTEMVSRFIYHLSKISNPEQFYQNTCMLFFCGLLTMF